MGKKKQKAKKGKSNGQTENRKQEVRPRTQQQSRVTVNSMKPPMGKFRGARGTGLAEPSELYFKALVNPWGEFSRLPCVPSETAEMTYRYRSVQRGSFSTGTTSGVGFISWAPLNPLQDAAAAVNSSITWSNATYTGTTFAAPGAAGTTSGTKNTPFVNAAFITPGNALSARLVSSVMRITNTTNSLTRNGSVLAARAEQGQALATIAGGSLNNLENVRVNANSDRVLGWGFVPQEEGDRDFVEGAYTYSSAAGNRGAQNYGFLVVGQAGASLSQSFDWELIEFWEFAGGTSTVNLPNLEKCESDPVGLARVLEAISVPRQSLDLLETARFYADTIVEMMAHSDSAAKTVEDLLGLSGLSVGNIASLAKSLVGMVMQ